MARLIGFDNAVTPLAAKGGKKKRSRPAASAAGAPEAVPEMEVFSEGELNAARDELEREASAELGGAAEAAREAWDSHAATLVAVAGRGRVPREQLARAGLAAALRGEHARVSQQNSELAAQCQKLESKLTVLFQGYAARAEGLSVVSASEQLARAAIDAHCFRNMQITEERSIQRRLAKLEAEVAVMQAREELLQKEYSALLLEQQSVKK